MRTVSRFWLLCSWLPLAACCLPISKTMAASVEVITPANRPAIEGKEVDWIDGDYVLRNDQLVAVIARPVEGRDANMTVREVGGGVIDLTRIDDMSDQLSAFYPAAGRYLFHDDASVETGEFDGGVFWRCRSSGSVQDNGTVATVEYRLRDGDPFLTLSVTIDGPFPEDFQPADAVRADRTFRFGVIEENGVAYCQDEFFRQTYGIEPVEAGLVPRWGEERLRQLRYVREGEADAESSRPEDCRWSVRLYPANSLLDLWGLTRGASRNTFQVLGAVGMQPRVRLSVTEDIDGRLPADWSDDERSWRGGENGRSLTHLPAGRYRIRAEAIGHQPVEEEIEVGEESNFYTLTFESASRVIVTARDGSGNAIPCKVTFYGQDVETPSFGPDSADGSIENCVYAASGYTSRSIPPGTYEVVISHGPEYDAAFETIEVPEGEPVNLDVTLRRVVDTSGWVSAELHSHSSPSGDNTSSQLGRVQNLVCEHLEFAPCTEHQRIDSYDEQLEQLEASHLMATCSGMELTGNPLPINHQNAFPLVMKPFQQSGGGPRTDTNPVVQIQRLAMWDDASDKVVQGNHPTFPQMLRDRDLDGVEDGGFASMLDFMDIVEVHPPEDIFRDFENQPEEEAQRNRMHHWMRLIATGRRLPGVVNTDAHYNWHGSGWLRNWVRSSTDVPAEIDIDEMTRNLEAGRVMMSTGPFMTVSLHADELDAPAEVGDTVLLEEGSASLAVKIQCPNWLDVNRVEVFVGGRPVPELSRTRESHPEAFGDGVVKFDQQLPLRVDNDTFVIVAAIGEGQTLGRVMGETFGARPPVVVSNPIYVNVAKGE